MIHDGIISSIVQYTKCEATSISKALAESILYKHKQNISIPSHCTQKITTWLPINTDALTINSATYLYVLL